MPRFGVGVLSFWSLGILVPLTPIDFRSRFFNSESMAHNKYLFKAPDFDKSTYQDLLNLTETEIDQIFTLVKDGNNVSVIRSQFPQIKQGKFDKYLPFVLSEEACEHCGGTVYIRYGRDTSTKGLYQIGKECVDCGHNYKPGCRCEKCKEEADIFWLMYLDKKYSEPIEIEKLDIQSKLQLSILIRKYQDSETPYIRFIEAPKKSYRYGSSFSYTILPNGMDDLFYSLKKKNILIPASVNNSQFVRLLGNGKAEIEPYDMTDVLWDINLTNDGERLSASDFLTLVDSQSFSIEEKSFLWRSIYLDEITQYLNHQSQAIFYFTFNPMFTDFITDLFIEKYSLSQAFAQIYYAMSMSLRYIAKYSPTQQKVVSNFRNNIIRNMDRYDRHKSSQFNRPSYVEGSYLNNYILDHILKVKGDYFSAYTENIIPEYVPLMEEIEDNQ